MKSPKIDSFKSTRTLQPEAVSMPDTARPIKRSAQANGPTVRVNRTVTPTNEPSVLQELNQGVVNTNERPTERYSFEIYTDQKQQLRDLQYRYEKRTGRRLSASRIIREAITAYLDQALDRERFDT